MGSFILKDPQIRYGLQDLTCILNQLNVAYGADLKENTTFCQQTKTRLPGLLTAGCQMNGFFDGSFDGGLFGNVGAASKPFSFAPTGAVEGGVAFLVAASKAEYSPGANHGELFSFAANIESSGPLVRGLLASYGVKTVSENGPALLLGAVPAGSKLYAALHVTANGGSGDQTLDVDVVSDDDGTFDSNSTTRGSFTQIGAANGYQLLEIGPAITDTYWRVSLTIAGTGSPSYTVFCVLGISDK